MRASLELEIAALLMGDTSVLGDKSESKIGYYPNCHFLIANESIRLGELRFLFWQGAQYNFLPLF